MLGVSTFLQRAVPTPTIRPPPPRVRSELHTGLEVLGATHVFLLQQTAGCHCSDRVDGELQWLYEDKTLLFL